MEEPELFKVAVRPPKRKKPPQEFKVVALRDCPVPELLLKCETPEHAADYWRRCISILPSYNPDKESFVVLLLTPAGTSKAIIWSPPARSTRCWCMPARCSALPSWPPPTQ